MLDLELVVAAQREQRLLEPDGLPAQLLEPPLVVRVGVRRVRRRRQPHTLVVLLSARRRRVR